MGSGFALLCGNNFHGLDILVNTLQKRVVGTVMAVGLLLLESQEILVWLVMIVLSIDL